MGKLFDLVQQLFDTLMSVWEFVWGLIQDLLYICTLLPKLVAKIPSLIESFMPPAVVSIILVLITLTVIYRVMGRD